MDGEVGVRTGVAEMKVESEEWGRWEILRIAAYVTQSSWCCKSNDEIKDSP